MRYRVGICFIISVLFYPLSTAWAGDFFGSVCAGYGQLLQPDAESSANASLRKGGVQAYFQGLWGEERLKYGAETGIMEAYTNWDNNGNFLLKRSLAFIPINAILQYDFTGDPKSFIPFIFGGPGFYFPVEGGSSDENGGAARTSSSSKIYSGAAAGIGVRFPAGQKYSILLNLRYSNINAPDNVSVFGLCLGFGTRLNLMKKEKPVEIKISTQPK
ncbi:MAG: hypothetical protein LHV68_03350 [Elusimicrobia bacterium]|nr:hypothetical protein [Candidatus Liberimonas magnetica]